MRDSLVKAIARARALGGAQRAPTRAGRLELEGIQEREAAMEQSIAVRGAGGWI